MLQPESHLGVYRLIGPLGSGGMGEVWKAEDTRLGRIVAVKVLPTALAADADAIGRLRREARTAAQLNHPNIAMIHAFEEAQGRLFIAMEYVEGEPLTSLIRRGPLSEGEVCRIGRNIADALADAHAKDIVHRDIKPDNVIVNGARVKVLDFGIAKRVGPESLVGDNDPTAFRTQTGMIIGTVTYMSPEQALGRPVDARTDIFSLGVLLYQMATGRLPFYGQSPTETIMQIVRDEPSSLRGAVSPALEGIIRRCLQKNPADRFPTARALATALETRAESAPTVVTGARPAPKRWPAIATMSALGIAIVLAAIVALRPRIKPAAAAAKPVPLTTSSSVEVSTTVEVAAAAVTGQEPQPTTTTAVVIEPVNKPPTNIKTANDHYNEGLVRLVERQPFQAREAFESAVELDPRHAKSHFRLGQIALFGRDFPLARHELHAALADGNQLEARERKLAELGLAVLDRDREKGAAIVAELEATNPGDPDLLRFRELVEAAQGQRSRGRRKKP
jgi:hypothetical protein